MLEEMGFDTELVYVRLLYEGTAVLRPTLALALGDDQFELMPTQNYDPDDEVWEFLPGSRVRCVARKCGEDMILVAYTQVDKSQ